MIFNLSPTAIQARQLNNPERKDFANVDRGSLKVILEEYREALHRLLQHVQNGHNYDQDGQAACTVGEALHRLLEDQNAFVS